MRPWATPPQQTPAPHRPFGGATRWVARPPAPVRQYKTPRSRVRYSGPPSYPVPPRWGFPALVWRWPTALPGLGPKTSPLEQTVHLARQLEFALSVLAGATALAAIGEVWRYVLLVQSLFGALGEAAVLSSDLVLTISSVLSLAGSVLVTVLGVLWLMRARQTAEEFSGLRPSRPDWQVLVGTLVPGLNLAVPGSTLAELEHTALGKPAADRPRPSRLVLAWWGAWAVGAALLVITMLWYLRSSVQAQADGVLLHAVTDLVAATVCVLSVRLVRYLTALLAPVDLSRTHLRRVVKVTGAPPPPLRADRPADAQR